ncbi:MAG: S26 family signal peptidase [Flavobacterium sp. MedPE-SWcel]|uniref:signal peptidase I n=1 Tax=uncultured Flavobacterium sp. TaxID=165435 RepID=UPI00091D8137|nr:signal peptidase I [uncultured Flavobacterium sp.]OIQ21033.1 MAG: S26 family signal peptidase [Flavobacterium sp. MedPE-SWcel]
MTLLEWFLFFLVVQVVHFAGTWKLYQKAGRKPWEAAIPIYNGVVLMRIIGRSPLWVLLLFVPIINIIMFFVIWVETLRSFGKNSDKDTLLGIITLGFYIYYINYVEDVTYKSERSLKASTKTGDTISSLLFAIVVATLVHTYVMQPFTIPTSSLEKTLLVGDFLFVSKFHYGARTPMTAVAAPMVHDTIPLANVKSYTKKPQLPYFRLPGFENAEKNDIVVFNWPVDTVRFFGDKKSIGIRKPIDKKSNYVKRCVGRPGDTLTIKNGVVYIDGKELILSERAKPQRFYPLETTGPITQDFLNKYDITEIRYYYSIRQDLWDNADVQDHLKGPKVRANLTEFKRDSTAVEVFGYIQEQQMQRLGMQMLRNKLHVNLTDAKVTALRNDSFVKEVTDNYIYPPSSAIFPYSKSDWSVDNMGPIYIPQEGKTVELNEETLPFYKMIISEYENNDLKVNGDEIRINGEIVTNYTFKQNYYWMMGDNRHNSEDSRYWGYVPEDHIVGKPVFIWMSLDANEPWSNISKKIRWDRMFTTVSGDGEPVSYFNYFLIALAAWFGFDYFRKKKKKANND